MKPEPVERLVSSVLATCIPAAAGMALLLSWPTGGGSDPAGEGDASVLLVEMIPLEKLAASASTGAPGADSDSEAPIPPPLPVASKLPDARPPAARSPGPASVAPVATGAPVAHAAPVADPSSAIRYRDALLSHVARHRRYPATARREQIEGLVEVRFVLDRTGRVHDAWVVSSSGRMILDEEALATIRRAVPMPHIPPGLPDSIDITLPIDFEIG